MLAAHGVRAPRPARACGRPRRSAGPEDQPPTSTRSSAAPTDAATRADVLAAAHGRRAHRSGAPGRCGGARGRSTSTSSSFDDVVVDDPQLTIPHPAADRAGLRRAAAAGARPRLVAPRRAPARRPARAGRRGPTVRTAAEAAVKTIEKVCLRCDWEGETGARACPDVRHAALAPEPSRDERARRGPLAWWRGRRRARVRQGRGAARPRPRCPRRPRAAALAPRDRRGTGRPKSRRGRATGAARPLTAGVVVVAALVVIGVIRAASPTCRRPGGAGRGGPPRVRDQGRRRPAVLADLDRRPVDRDVRAGTASARAAVPGPRHPGVARRRDERRRTDDGRVRGPAPIPRPRRRGGLDCCPATSAAWSPLGDTAAVADVRGGCAADRGLDVGSDARAAGPASVADGGAPTSTSLVAAYGATYVTLEGRGGSSIAQVEGAGFRTIVPGWEAVAASGRDLYVVRSPVGAEGPVLEVLTGRRRTSSIRPVGGPQEPFIFERFLAWGVRSRPATSSSGTYGKACAACTGSRSITTAERRSARSASSRRSPATSAPRRRWTGRDRVRGRRAARGPRERVEPITLPEDAPAPGRGRGVAPGRGHPRPSPRRARSPREDRGRRGRPCGHGRRRPVARRRARDRGGERRRAPRPTAPRCTCPGCPSCRARDGRDRRRGHGARRSPTIGSPRSPASVVRRDRRAARGSRTSPARRGSTRSTPARARAGSRSTRCRRSPTSERAVARLDGCAVAVGADDEEGFALGERLARDLGGVPFRLTDEARPLYHAAAVLGSNDVVALSALALAALRARGRARSRGGPGAAAAATVENVATVGPGAALTGPAVRGDAGTIEANLAALAAAVPDAVGVPTSPWPAPRSTWRWRPGA